MNDWQRIEKLEKEIELLKLGHNQLRETGKMGIDLMNQVNDNALRVVKQNENILKQNERLISMLEKHTIWVTRTKHKLNIIKEKQ